MGYQFALLQRGRHGGAPTRFTTGDLPEICRGLMISLDVAKALDCMPFGVMYESRREVGVSDALARLVVETRRQSTCIVRHCGSSIRVSMKRALRPGCPFQAFSRPGLFDSAECWVLSGVELT